MKAEHPRVWEQDAHCFDRDDEYRELLEELDIPSVTELFYPPRIKERYHVYANKARDFCFGADRRHPCPALKQCLLWAIENDEEHGIWGGQSHRERNALVRKAEANGVSVRDYIDGL